MDYELCLGEKTGTVYNSLIMPMEKLAEVFDKYNIKVTIMVDSSYLLVLRNNMIKFNSLSDDYKMIVSQLKALSKNGHSIQLHIHPQWYYSSFDGKEWNLDFEHYKLSDMPPKDVILYFNESKLLLESIIGKKVDVFRAGGFSLQTYDEHCELLRVNNIKIDTSVVPGTFEKSKHQWYDYRELPNKIYMFSKSVVQIESNGDLLEIPVSTVRLNPIHYLILRKIIEITNSSFKPFSEGQGIGQSYSIINRRWSLIKQIFRIKYAGASLDSFSSYLLPFVYKKHRAINGNNCFVIIGHPKSASNNSISGIDRFIKDTINSSTYKTLNEILIQEENVS